MFRDLKAGLPVEADHIIGDLIGRGNAAGLDLPHLKLAYTHLKVDELQRQQSLLSSSDR